ncbi:MAG: cbb3-type cytochrome c oxidase subunit I, partial [Actinobacteria bacterium]|nr:cbb3-type cytochrome c oxidase subunit I [Actinomycetota bacterium]
YFVVAHLHYVLMGGAVFGIFAGIYYWFPKIAGRMLSEPLGKASFALMFIGFHVTFLIQHSVGLSGMPRRVYTYRDDVGWGLWNLVSTIGSYLLALGILLFVVNAAISLRRGRQAGDNPWDAGTLEWATQSPPAPYNVASIPQVATRDPLWERSSASPEQAREPARPVSLLLAGDPGGEREVIRTSVLDAQPEAVVRLTSASYTPLVAAAGLIPFFAGLLAKLPLLSIAGAALTAAAFLKWGWKGGQGPEHGAGDEQRHAGLPVDPGGGGTIGALGVLLGVMVLASFQLSLVSSYSYLRFQVDEWPPDGLAIPGTAGAAIAAALLVASALPAAIAAWSRRAALVRGSVLAALALGTSAGALIAAELLDAPFGAGEHAYASLFWVLLGAQLVFVAAGVAALAALALRVLLGRLGHERGSGTGIVMIYWGFVVASGVITLATVYLGPRVL